MPQSIKQNAYRYSLDNNIFKYFFNALGIEKDNCN